MAFNECLVNANYSRCPYDALARHVRSRYLLSRRLRPLQPAFNPSKVKVAVHIRRGDITRNNIFLPRVLSCDYYAQALTLLRELAPSELLDIAILTNEIDIDIENLAENVGARIVKHGNDIQDFHTLSSCDILVASKSGFSYLASLINIRALKLVPRDFWHEWPADSIQLSIENEALPLLKSRISSILSCYQFKAIEKQHSTKCIWNKPPSTVGDNIKLRDYALDNASSYVRIFASPTAMSDVGGIHDTCLLLSRRLLGCIVSTDTNKIDPNRSMLHVDEAIITASAFIEINTYINTSVTFVNSLASFLKVEFNEALMNREFLVSSKSPLPLSVLSMQGFHSSITFRLIKSMHVYCNDLIILKLQALTKSSSLLVQ